MYLHSHPRVFWEITHVWVGGQHWSQAECQLSALFLCLWITSQIDTKVQVEGQQRKALSPPNDGNPVRLAQAEKGCSAAPRIAHKGRKTGPEIRSTAKDAAAETFRNCKSLVSWPCNTAVSHTRNCLCLPQNNSSLTWLWSPGWVSLDLVR